jgi:hypothetical protein
LITQTAEVTRLADSYDAGTDRENATLVPSGDHAGWMSSIGSECVSCVWFEPSASITQICAVPVRFDVNAIRSRFGLARRPTSVTRGRDRNAACVLCVLDVTSRPS